MKRIDSTSDDYKKMFASRSENGVAIIPDHLGKGYIKGFIIENKLRLLVRQYELNDDLLLDRGIGQEEQKLIMISIRDMIWSKTAKLADGCILRQEA